MTHSANRETADALALLRAARAHLEVGWCQGALGRTPEGTALPREMLSQACEVSALGGLWKAGLTLGFQGYADAFDTLAFSIVGLDSLVYRERLRVFNDDEGTTQADVLRLYDRAIVRLEGQQ